MKNISVLISQPNFQYKNRDEVHLPHVYGVLRSYANRDPLIREKVTWLDPIYLYDDPETYYRRLEKEHPSVLGLSCYIWNWKFQLDIARYVKKLNPDCLIVMGGQQPDWQDEAFFKKYEFIDIIVRQEGEEPFYQILLKIINGEKDFSHIPGLFLNINQERVNSGTAELLKDFDYYPFQECDEVYRKIIQSAKKTTAIWETNRGCPYHCSFCDWGGLTNTKIRQIPEKRLAEEMQWFADNKVYSVMLSDANFGILPRDITFAENFAACKHKKGYPVVLEYDSAKMNISNNIKIAKTLWKDGLITKVKIPWQHLDKEVLRAIDRKEPPIEKKAKIVEEVQKEGMKCRPELILGMPGDNLNKIRKAIYQIFEFNLSDALRTNLMLILPNAPAAQKSYRERWQIKTRWKPLPPVHVSYDHAYENSNMKALVEVVVGTSSYSEEEWIEMMTFDSYIKVLHSIGGLTKYIAYYLRHNHQVPFENFYNDMFDNFIFNKNIPVMKKMSKDIRSKRLDYLQTERPDYYQYKGAPLGFLLGGDEYLYAKVMDHFVDFYEALTEYVSEKYRDQVSPAILTSLLSYQREIMVREDYDFKKGKEIASEFNWPGYFAKCFSCFGSQKPFFQLERLDSAHTLKACDFSSSYLLKKRFDWSLIEDPSLRKGRWLETMVSRWNHWALEGTRNFQNIQLVKKGPSSGQMVVTADSSPLHGYLE